jgi:HEAT repeat protein
MLWWTLQQLKSGSAETRKLAAKELGESKDPRAVEALAVALKDANLHVRFQARNSLDQIDAAWAKSEAARRAIPTVVAALGHSDWLVRDSAAWGLGEIGDAGAVEPLIAALRNRELDVQGQAAVSLGKIGDARAVEPLIAALADTNHCVRGAAAEALGKIGDARAVEPLIAALMDTESLVRQRAAEAVGKIRDARAVEPLAAVVKDVDWVVRQEAVRALLKIGGVRAVEPLIAALMDTNSWVRAEAADGLENIGGPAAEEALRRYRTRPFCCARCGNQLEEIGIPPQIQVVQMYKQVVYIESESVPPEVIADPYLYRGLYCPSCNQAFCPTCAKMQTECCPRCHKSGLMPGYRPLLKRIAA